MQIRLKFAVCGAVVLGLMLAGCQRESTKRSEYPMGEKLPIGSLVYDAVESGWRTQFGDVLEGLRTPKQRFLTITLSATNTGNTDVSLPFFVLENTDGQSFEEVQDGRGVDNWFGMLRTIAAGQTQQGRIVFDVPLASYKLRVTDGAGPAAEKYAWITIPLRMDVDSDVPATGVGISDSK